MKSDAALSDVQLQKSYDRRVISWAWYDWANHAYITTTAAAFFPPYFIAIATASFMAIGASVSDEAAKAVARDIASNIFALMISFALLVSAVLAPIVGAFADITGRRKRLLIITTIAASLVSSLMFILVTGMWQLALGLYFVIPGRHEHRPGLFEQSAAACRVPEDMNRVSSLGYAMGYVGGGLLLALNTALFLFSDKLGIDSTLAVRIAFLSVGIWWIVFTIPLILNVTEPPATPLAHGSRGSGILDSFTRLGNTVRDAARYRELFKMLIAFWFYMEGIGAIILLATSYGAALGLNTAVLIGTLLMTQFVAFPYALIYGRIPIPSNRWRGVFRLHAHLDRGYLPTDGTVCQPERRGEHLSYLRHDPGRPGAGRVFLFAVRTPPVFWPGAKAGHKTSGHPGSGHLHHHPGLGLFPQEPGRVLHDRMAGGNGAGRYPGAQPVDLRLTDPARQIGRVLWTVRLERKIRRNPRSAPLWHRRHADPQPACQHPLHLRILHRRYLPSGAGE